MSNPRNGHVKQVHLKVKLTFCSRTFESKTIILCKEEEDNTAQAAIEPQGKKNQRSRF